MRVLVIGGTRFVGRHIVEALLARGHPVTLFHRGVTGADLFAEAEHVLGDRDESLRALSGRSFDAVVDTSAYFPRQVRAVAGALGGGTWRYILISSISVFRDPVAPGTDEVGPLWELDGPEPRVIDTAQSYGVSKVLCERAAEQHMPNRALVVRPGLVVGPHDHTDRFTYWPRRVARGGRMLTGAPGQPVQFIDARDLAAFVADGVEETRTGIFNTTGPAEPLTTRGLIDAARAETAAEVEVVSASDDFLLEHGVEPFDDLPLWVPRDDWGFLQIDCSKAIAAGLRFRPLRETIADTLAWDAQRLPADRKDAIAPEREEAMLAEILGA